MPGASAREPLLHLRRHRPPGAAGRRAGTRSRRSGPGGRRGRPEQPTVAPALAGLADRSRRSLPWNNRAGGAWRRACPGAVHRRSARAPEAGQGFEHRDDARAGAARRGRLGLHAARSGLDRRGRARHCAAAAVAGGRPGRRLVCRGQRRTTAADRLCRRAHAQGSAIRRRVPVHDPSAQRRSARRRPRLQCAGRAAPAQREARNHRVRAVHRADAGQQRRAGNPAPLAGRRVRSWSSRWTAWGAAASSASRRATPIPTSSWRRRRSMVAAR